MIVLGYGDLLQVMKDGLLEIEGDLGPFSVDVKLGQLYEKREIRSEIFGLRELGLNTEEFIKIMLRPIDIPKEGLVVTAEDRYFWQPTTDIKLCRGLAGEIVTRSSYARLGVQVFSKPLDEMFGAYYCDYQGKPLCSLSTQGTRVRIKPEEPLGQIVVSATGGYIPRERYEILIDEGSLVVKQVGKVQMHRGVLLTMGPKIKIYNPKTILVPGKPANSDFNDGTIGSITGLYLPAGAFFLSASEQHVEIPNTYVGFVSEGNSAMTTQELGKKFWKGEIDVELVTLPFISHPNAPFIGPNNIFRGNITFENRMKWGAEIRRGMKQGELLLYPLLNPSNFSAKSRYSEDGQLESKLD